MIEITAICRFHLTFEPASRHNPLNTDMNPKLIALIILSLPFVAAAEIQLATFALDVTPPPGHACMGGGVAPIQRVGEPLQARGFVLMGDGQPFVVVSFDWCEIRGSAYDDWRAALAEAAGTVPQRVLVTSTHVHDAPVMDPEAEFILREAEHSGAWKDLPAPDAQARIQLASVCWPDFNRLCIQRARLKVKEALTKPQRVTHIGTGSAEVREVASNRRYLLPDGGVRYNRMSRNSLPEAAAAGVGEIDPLLRTLSFWDGDTLLCALHSYAVHPMSYYGTGETSIDFVGLAREQLQKEMPTAFHIYATGCAGNVTAGKFNDGARANRPKLTSRIADAMHAALKNTTKQPLQHIGFRLAKIPLAARTAPDEFTEAALRNRLLTSPVPFMRAEAAMGLSWYQRVQSGHQIDLPLLDFGSAKLMLLPAEAYVDFQLYATQLVPGEFLLVMGYGECGPGYIPIERAWRERDSNLRDWTWVGPGSEATLKHAIDEVLTPKSAR